jgi:hypothetical protein
MTLFEELAGEGQKARKAVLDQRVAKYRDTWKTCQWRVAKTVVGFPLLSDTHIIKITLAGLIDQKIERLSGGLDLDHLIDAGNYIDALIGVLLREKKTEWKPVTQEVYNGVDPDILKASNTH